MLPFLAAFAPIIGGAIGALGALLAPKPEPQTVTNSIDLKRLRSDAEASGFNPLTIIRGGGLSGYSSQVTSAAPDMRLSNAFQAFGSGVANFSYDPFSAAKSRTELRLMEAQIKSYGRSGAPSNMSFGTPKAKITGPAVLRNAWGGVFETGPGSPAADVQQEYGEMIGDIYGIERYASDLWRSLWAPEKHTGGW